MPTHGDLGLKELIFKEIRPRTADSARVEGVALNPYST
jgi:hypothetical protein